MFREEFFLILYVVHGERFDGQRCFVTYAEFSILHEIDGQSQCAHRSRQRLVLQVIEGQRR